MDRPLTNTEFFAFEGEVWFRVDGKHQRLQESDTVVIDEMIGLLDTFYPKAYKALCDEYKGCALNKWYYRFRIVTRFIKCNFAQLDNIPDVSDGSRCSFEYVSCPLRGECRLDSIVCRPEFDHKLSAAELPVMRLWFDGKSPDEIAEQLCLSPHTIHNHIRNAYQRIGVHSRGEFIKYASQNCLFK